MILTPRLLLRQLTLEDAPFIYELVNSPAWLKYIGDREVHSLEDAKKYIEERNIRSYQRYNFGFYAVERRADQILLGTCGLAQRDFLEHPDIGFAFLDEYTGQGYALEAAESVMKYAQEELGMTTILAFTLPSNERSIRLLEKIGLRNGGPFHLPDDPEELLLFQYP